MLYFMLKNQNQSKTLKLIKKNTNLENLKSASQGKKLALFSEKIWLHHAFFFEKSILAMLIEPAKATGSIISP